MLTLSKFWQIIQKTYGLQRKLDGPVGTNLQILKTINE